MDEWVNPQSWPEPKWFATAATARRLRYEDYFAYQLRTRYVELENEFRTVFGNFVMESLGGTPVDLVSAERVVSLLHVARRALEVEEPDLLMVSNTLDLVERYMLWLTPSFILVAAMPVLRLRAESLPERERVLFTDQLNQLYDESGELPTETGRLHLLRGVFDEVIGAYNQHMLREQIGSGLQLKRLRTLRLWGLLVLPVLLAAMPLIMPRLEATIEAWSQSRPGEALSVSLIWLLSSGVALMGALGGFLSGLLQVRSSRVTLAEYQDNMLKLQLRPLVGAIIALLLFGFLSWNLLPGIKIENLGSYFFAAFLSGFSERYFLRLIELEQTDAVEQVQTAGAAHAPVASPTVPVGGARNERRLGDRNPGAPAGRQLR
jgi:hypothetical protein